MAIRATALLLLPLLCCVMEAEWRFLHLALPVNSVQFRMKHSHSRAGQMEQV